MLNEWTQLSPETKVLSFVKLTKHTALGYYIGEGWSDVRPLHPCSGDRPHLLSRHEALAFARQLPEVEALVEAATAAAEYMLDADLCDADKEWRLGAEVRTVLAPFQEACDG